MNLPKNMPHTAQNLTKCMYDQIFDSFGLEVEHRNDTSILHGSEARDQILNDIKGSQLLTERIDDYHLDDVAKTKYLDTELIFSELHATRTEGSGKNKRVVNVFKGVFVKHTIPKTFSGHTFISTEGDKYGFGHRTFWNNLINTSKTTETILEWNDFEDEIEVLIENAPEEVSPLDYIKEELNNTTLTIDSRVGNEDNCISIYKTYQFN